MIPDVRLSRPRNLVIYDNLKKKIFYIENIFKDTKIKDYEESNFGEVTTDFSDEEKTANMLAYVLADEILNENNTYQLFSRMSGNFDEDKRDLLVDSLENS